VAEEINKNTTAGKKIQQMHSEAITLSGLRLLGLLLANRRPCAGACGALHSVVYNENVNVVYMVIMVGGAVSLHRCTG
jgi:hypothetical protein